MVSFYHHGPDGCQPPPSCCSAGEHGLQEWWMTVSLQLMRQLRMTEVPGIAHTSQARKLGYKSDSSAWTGEKSRAIHRF